MLESTKQKHKENHQMISIKKQNMLENTKQKHKENHQMISKNRTCLRVQNKNTKRIIEKDLVLK